MRMTTTFAIWLGVTLGVAAQTFRADISYQYMTAPTWDAAVQTYNFSRPFLTEQQPLFASGVGAALGYGFASSRPWQHGIQLGYAYFRSASENVDFENVLNLHFLQLGYLLRYQKSGGPYAEMMVSARGSLLVRHINGEPLEADEEARPALGVGAEMTLRVGYPIALGDGKYLSPFVALGYSPYLYGPDVEPAINQTKRLVGGDWTRLLVAQVGLAYHWAVSEK